MPAPTLPAIDARVNVKIPTLIRGAAPRVEAGTVVGHTRTALGACAIVLLDAGIEVNARAADLV